MDPLFSAPPRKSRQKSDKPFQVHKVHFSSFEVFLNIQSLEMNRTNTMRSLRRFTQFRRLSMEIRPEPAKLTSLEVGVNL